MDQNQSADFEVGLEAVPSGPKLAGESLTLERDLAEIRAVAGEYFVGYTRAAPALIAHAFHPVAVLYAVDEDKADVLEAVPLARWLTSLAERQARGDHRVGTLEIRNVDVTGPAAAAHLRLTFPKLVFDDYLSLLKIEGRWRIVGKNLHREPPLIKRAAITCGSVLDWRKSMAYDKTTFQNA